jgi:short-subunit dehydrogenase
VLVNNAGVATAGDSGVPPDARARATLEVNLFGTWQATAAALPALLAARHQGDAPGPPGQVVNVASGLAVAAMPYAAAYSASKRAVLAYSDALRMEYGDRLTVSAVLPGYIRTPIHDGPAAEGASLDGIVPAEPVAAAVAAIVAAIETRRRAVASTPRLHLELTAARLFPALAERVIARRVRRAASTRPQPSFLRFPQPAPATTATSGHESVRIPHQSVSRAGRRN